MKVIGINGSPRKKNNSAVMLDYALRGANFAGADVKKFNLFDLDYSGCKSCFECKRLGSINFGRCVLQDDLTEVIQNIFDSDALIVSTPIYFMDVPGTVRNLFERLWFPGLTYSKDSYVAYNKRIKVRLIYTMGVENESYFQNLYQQHKNSFECFFGETQIIFAVDALQFDDYSKYSSSMFDSEYKKLYHEKEFPVQCQCSYDMGIRLVKQ